MKIRYSRHAAERMRMRGITRKDIRAAILQGQSRVVYGDGGIKCRHKRKDDILVIIYAQEKDIFTIITAYHESNLR